jgi:VanZ family protein
MWEPILTRVQRPYQIQFAIALPGPLWFYPAVPALSSCLRWWGPVAAWMLLIFAGSSDSASGERSSRLLGPFLLWLFPRLSPEGLGLWIAFFRKCAHVAEYAILALLLWRALRRQARQPGWPWAWSDAWHALLGTCLYAASDEFHQMGVPNRQGSVGDVGIDTLGGALALLVLWLWRRLRSRALIPKALG